jgi:hypothetical protein
MDNPHDAGSVIWTLNVDAPPVSEVLAQPAQARSICPLHIGKLKVRPSN